MHYHNYYYNECSMREQGIVRGNVNNNKNKTRTTNIPPVLCTLKHRLLSCEDSRSNNYFTIFILVITLLK